MAEGSNSTALLHTYTCTSFLTHWSKELQELDDFSELLVFLQHLPTEKCTKTDIDDIIYRAYYIGQTEKTFVELIVNSILTTFLLVFTSYILMILLALWGASLKFAKN